MKLSNFSFAFLAISLILLTASQALGQAVPEVLYYEFEGSGSKIPNLATSAPSGTDSATLVGGHTLGGLGQCATGALRGSSGSAGYVSTGWAPSVSGSWTVSIWTDSIPSSTSLHYFFGDPTASNFRCFTGGAAGAGNFVLKGPLSDVRITGGASTTPTVSTWVYNSSTGYIYGYLNGLIQDSVSQSTISFSGTGPFLLGSFSGGPGSGQIPPGALLDAFRFYSRALTSAEVLALTHTTYITETTCDLSYTSPSGNYSYNSTGTYYDTIITGGTCDSFFVLDLTFLAPSYDTITQTAIDTFTLAGGQKVNTSGTYMDTFTNAVGCDSITTYNITITNRIYIDHTVSSSGTGDSWSQAFKTIDEALTCVNVCNSEAEIWVRAGTYTPSNLPHGDRNSTFLITNINTQLLGGFNGTETASSQRNPATNTTILSGDIGVSSDASDNLFHVLIIQDKRSYSGGEEVMNSDFTVDGFTISGGNANGGGRYGHNGMFVYESVGAGVVIISQGAGRVISPKISNCVFTGNNGFKGSAIYAKVNGGTCSSTYENCIFESNSCTYGTVHNDGMSGTVSPTISNCVFNNNTCRTSGGGIYSAAYAGTSNPTIQNCVFSNNTAANGGAIFNNGYNGTCSPSIINCTFYNNSALSAGAVYNFGGSGTCVPIVKNCIFSENSAAGVADFKYSEFYNYLATPTISYSSLQRASDQYSTANLNGLNSGSNNIFAQDPSFTSTTDLDGSDNLWRTADDGLMPASGSPVINAGISSGAPSTDIRGTGNNGTKDMGAYEVGGTVVP